MGYASPEEAALADWPESARVRVISVEVRGDRAEIVLDTVPSYQYWVYCVLTDGRWRQAVSGNAPTVGWDDPNQIHWS